MFFAEMLKIKIHCETTLPFTIKSKKHIYYTIKTPNKYRDCRNGQKLKMRRLIWQTD